VAILTAFIFYLNHQRATYQHVAVCHAVVGRVGAACYLPRRAPLRHKLYLRFCLRRRKSWACRVATIGSIDHVQAGIKSIGKTTMAAHQRRPLVNVAVARQHQIYLVAF